MSGINAESIDCAQSIMHMASFSFIVASFGMGAAFFMYVLHAMPCHGGRTRGWAGKIKKLSAGKNDDNDRHGDDD